MKHFLLILFGLISAIWAHASVYYERVESTSALTESDRYIITASTPFNSRIIYVTKFNGAYTQPDLGFIEYVAPAGSSPQYLSQEDFTTDGTPAEISLQLPSSTYSRIIYNDSYIGSTYGSDLDIYCFSRPETNDSYVNLSIKEETSSFGEYGLKISNQAAPNDFFVFHQGYKTFQTIPSNMLSGFTLPVFYKVCEKKWLDINVASPNGIVNLRKGETVKLPAVTITDPETGKVVSDDDIRVTYTVSGSNGCVTVNSETGEITGVGAGEATVVVNFESIKYQALDAIELSVIVSSKVDAYLDTANPDEPIEITVGETVKLPEVNVCDPIASGTYNDLVRFIYTVSPNNSCITFNPETREIIGVKEGTAAIEVSIESDEVNASPIVFTVNVAARANMKVLYERVDDLSELNEQDTYILVASGSCNGLLGYVHRFFGANDISHAEVGYIDYDDIVAPAIITESDFAISSTPATLKVLQEGQYYRLAYYTNELQGYYIGFGSGSDLFVRYYTAWETASGALINTYLSIVPGILNGVNGLDIRNQADDSKFMVFYSSFPFQSNNEGFLTDKWRLPLLYVKKEKQEVAISTANLDEAVEVKKGESVKLPGVTITDPTTGETVTDEDIRIVYTVKEPNDGSVTVDPETGKVTGVKDGEATIVVTIESDKYTADPIEIKVKVTEPAAAVMYKKITDPSQLVEGGTYIMVSSAVVDGKVAYASEFYDAPISIPAAVSAFVTSADEVPTVLTEDMFAASTAPAYMTLEILDSYNGYYRLAYDGGYISDTNNTMDSEGSIMYTHDTESDPLSISFCIQSAPGVNGLAINSHCNTDNYFWFQGTDRLFSQNYMIGSMYGYSYPYLYQVVPAEELPIQKHVTISTANPDELVEVKKGESVKLPGVTITDPTTGETVTDDDIRIVYTVKEPNDGSVTVDPETGKVTGVKDGEATIVVTIESDKYTADPIEIKVKVTEPAAAVMYKKITDPSQLVEGGTYIMVSSAVVDGKVAYASEFYDAPISIPAAVSAFVTSADEVPAVLTEDMFAASAAPAYMTLEILDSYNGYYRLAYNGGYISDTNNTMDSEGSIMYTHDTESDPLSISFSIQSAPGGNGLAINSHCSTDNYFWFQGTDRLFSQNYMIGSMYGYSYPYLYQVVPAEESGKKKATFLVSDYADLEVGFNGYFPLPGVLDEETGEYLSTYGDNKAGDVIYWLEEPDYGVIELTNDGIINTKKDGNAVIRIELWSDEYEAEPVEVKIHVWSIDPTSKTVTYDFTRPSTINCGQGIPAGADYHFAPNACIPAMEDNNVLLTFGGASNARFYTEAGYLHAPFASDIESGSRFTVSFGNERMHVLMVEVEMVDGDDHSLHCTAGSFAGNVWTRQTAPAPAPARAPAMRAASGLTRSVTFSPTDKDHQISRLHVTYAEEEYQTGVESVACEQEAEYYTLQGVKVSRPVPGIYIRVRGNVVDKILIK